MEALHDLALLTRDEEPQTLTAAFLYFAEHHTQEEIAEVLGVSRKTTSKMLRQFTERARKRSLRFDMGGAV